MNNLFLLIMTIITIPLGIYTHCGGNVGKIIILLIFSMQLFLTEKFKYTQGLLLLSLYLFIYVLYFIPYFYQGMDLSEWTEYQNSYYFNLTIYQFYIFYLGLCIGASYPMNENKRILINKISFESSPLNIFFYSILLLFIIKSVLNIGVNVLDSTNPYEAYIENLDNSSSLPLFAIVFIFILYVNIKNKYLKTLFLCICFSILLYHNITRGFRILIPIIILCIFISKFELKWKTSSLLIMFCLGFAGLILLNNLKNGDNFSLNTLFSEEGNNFILSHHADSLYGSACMNGVIIEGELTIIDRFKLLMGFILESIVPPSLLPIDMKYPLFINELTITGGGGLCPTGCYVMGGYPLTLLFPILYVRFINYCYKEDISPYIKFAGIITLILFPRWISYDFHVILRIPIIACTILFLLSKLKSEELFCE